MPLINTQQAEPLAQVFPPSTMSSWKSLQEVYTAVATANTLIRESHLALCIPKFCIHSRRSCRRMICDSGFPLAASSNQKTSRSCWKEVTTRLYEATFTYPNSPNHKATQEAGTLNCVILQGETEDFVPARCYRQRRGCTSPALAEAVHSF